jgi:hypothetical protein
MTRFLTKSRFKVGYECPSKLYFLDRKEYGNNNVANSFLEALAEGGFQVGELAKIYHPGGTEITAKDKGEAAKETSKLLKQENAVIYEACFSYQNLFIKADIVVKTGNKIDLIEVKAKSFDPSEDNAFFTKTSIKKGKPQLNSEWEPYVMDAAFQAYVLKKVYPQFELQTFLMLADKTAVATVDGLNQKFFLDKSVDGRAYVRVAPGTLKEALGRSMLCKVSVDREVEVAWNGKYFQDKSFSDLVVFLSDIVENGTFAEPIVGGNCKSCEFRIGSEKKAQGKESGFEKCWQHVAVLKPCDFKKPLVFDIWNFRKSQAMYEDNKILMEKIEESDIAPKIGGEGLTSSERQWLQVSKVRDKDSSPYFDIDGLAAQMQAWKFPLHFIDFETTMAAIPFNRGRKPYEQLAFQFSHHVVEKDGTVSHSDEYLNRHKGKFPNFDFLRSLKFSLEKDEGTIFRYAAHENTVLCQIRTQLLETKENIPDRDELVSFIQSITNSTDNSDTEWLGTRNMVDMCELVKLYYFHPLTKGSNSIKKVLPAILQDSEFIKHAYSKPIYGSKQIKSLNYKGWAWVQFDAEGKVVDPYKLLPPVFQDVDLETMDSLITEGSLADGGAAMTAYARMQFTEMSQLEFDRVSAALLKYCELDTFAMVLIYQHWKNEIEKTAG